MNNLAEYKDSFLKRGFAVLNGVYQPAEVTAILETVAKVDTANERFRKSEDLFAIRQFLKEVPGAFSFLFNQKLRNIIATVFGKDYFITKSIYFDKPAKSNWYVAFHQDLTISVDQRKDIEGFGPWTIKQNQFAVQPPLQFLENNFTMRIHLDDTTEENGALKVLPGTHARGVVRAETLNKENITSCHVEKGGVMLMHPLLVHASGRSTNDKARRVVHIEFSNKELPGDLRWSEQVRLN